MKKLLTRIMATVAGFAMAIGVGVGVATNKVATKLNAADQVGTINFNNTQSGTAIDEASVTGDDSLGNTWTVTTVGTTSFTSNNAYYQVGSSKKPATSITFTASLDEAQTISAFSAKFGGFGDTAGSVALKVGSNTVGTGSLNGTNDVIVSATDGTKTSTDLTVTVTGISKGVKVYYISYTYDDGEEPPIPPEVKYSVTYADGGADSGTVPVDNNEYDSGDPVTVLGNTGNLAKDEYAFGGWSDGNATYQPTETFEITEDTTLTAVWNEIYDEGAETYDLSEMFNSGTWTSSYTNHSHEFVTSQNESVVVSIPGSNKQSSGNPITDVPVAKGSDVTFVLDSSTRYIKNVVFHAKQWEAKPQTMTLYTSNNQGESYTNTEITSSNFRIKGTNFAVGTNAIKITFSSGSNQVGYVDFVVTYDDIPTVEATSMTITPSSLSIYCDESGSFTPTLSGGQGNYEKTITWTSSEPSIIAAPTDSEAGVQITVNPSTVDADIEVTLTGTVDVENGASSSIVITVKALKVVSVDSVSISGIVNNSELDGENDRSITINETLQLSATVNYNQGDAYMDGNNHVSWSSNADAVATVNQNGLVTLKGNGTVTIAATSEEDDGKSGTLTFTISNLRETYGTENNPYTVAEARAAIDAGEGVNGVYATGIVSSIVTAYNPSYGNISYNISNDGSTQSDQLEAYRGKNNNGENFTSADDVIVGATVIIYGNLIKHNTTYEFAADNQLISHIRPNLTGITLNETSLELTAGESESLTASPLPVGADLSSVTWTSSNSAVASVNENGEVTAITEGSTTITAKSGNISSACTVTVTAVASNKVFKANNISVGDVVVLAAEKDTAKKQLSSIDGHGAVTNYTNEPDTSVAPLTVEDGSQDDTFALKLGEVYLSWSSGNSLSTSAEINDNSSWTITFSGTVPTIKNVADNTRVLKYNSSQPRFACYTSAQTDVILWKVRSINNSLSLATSYAILQGNETNDGNTVSVDSVSIRFGARIPEAAWNAINADWTITDYGLMLTQQTKLGAYSSITQAYAAGERFFTVMNKKAGTAPADYSFYAKIKYSNPENYDVVVCAVPYIVAGGHYYFLDEMTYSVNSMLNDFGEYGSTTLSAEALAVLAAK